MCSRDFSAARCTWLMFLTPTRSSTEPTWPLRTSVSSVWPGAPLAPVGPDISSWPIFSASVIFLISALTLAEMAASRCCADANLGANLGAAWLAGTETSRAATASGTTARATRRTRAWRWGDGFVMDRGYPGTDDSCAEAGDSDTGRPRQDEVP